MLQNSYRVVKIILQTKESIVYLRVRYEAGRSLFCAEKGVAAHRDGSINRSD